MMFLHAKHGLACKNAGFGYGGLPSKSLFPGSTQKSFQQTCAARARRIHTTSFRVQQLSNSSQTQASAPTPPPYSQLSVPVYSLATTGMEGTNTTMNLMIYALPISLTPRHFAIGLYANTLSRDNMLATRRGVLQILGEQHAQLFQLLGKTSGRDVDKIGRLSELGFDVKEWKGVPTLADSCGLMELEFATEPYCAGDHDVAICKVVDYHTPSAGGRPLYTGFLRQQGLYS